MEQERDRYSQIGRLHQAQRHHLPGVARVLLTAHVQGDVIGGAEEERQSGRQRVAHKRKDLLQYQPVLLSDASDPPAARSLAVHDGHRRYEDDAERVGGNVYHQGGSQPEVGAVGGAGPVEAVVLDPAPHPYQSVVVVDERDPGDQRRQEHDGQESGYFENGLRQLHQAYGHHEQVETHSEYH